MDIEQTKKAIEIMQAFVDGKEIEYSYSGIWNKTTQANGGPSWNWGTCNYRIAKRKEKRTGWINVYPSCTAGVWDTQDQANYDSSPTRIACIKIEYEV